MAITLGFHFCCRTDFLYTRLFFCLSSVFYQKKSTVIDGLSTIFASKTEISIQMRKLKITELNRIDRESFKAAKKIPLVVVLDNVRSLHNAGAVFRTSDAFPVESVYLCGITATPPHAEIHKTALGAEDSVTWKYVENTCDAVNELKRNGYTVLAVEQAEESTMLDAFRPDEEKRYAVVFGNEVKGVQQQVMDLCDGCIEIPQFGTKHSLNVSVAAGIVIWVFLQTFIRPHK
jgi:tRNA G18 (ribose-2'-O)-methylase SpoU